MPEIKALSGINKLVKINNSPAIKKNSPFESTPNELLNKN
jgi:hypothetical protein